jgi:hypothetical protein
MSSYRIPGPVCGSSQPRPIDDGTLSRWLAPPLGPVCASSPLYAASLLTGARADADVSFLFRQCLNPARGLSEADYADAAQSLGVEIAVIKAVAEVESPRGPFDSQGRPEILFERHYFHRLTAGEHDAAHPDISSSTAGGYGKFSAQYPKLQRAYELNPDAALRSASWGRFQIMGNNYEAAGFTSVVPFVRAMTKSELEHLNAFVHFVKSDPAQVSALQKKDWAGFAVRYNGKAYKKNNYDVKLEAAYEKFAAAAAAPGGTAGSGSASPIP